MSKPRKHQPPSPPDADGDPDGIPFRGEAVPAEAEAAPASPAVPELETGDLEPFKIEWFDEEHQPTGGHLFAEPTPEPPLQPYEIIREPRQKETPRSQSSGRTPVPGAPAGGAPPRHMAAVSSRPPLWKRLIWGLMPILLLLGGYASVVLTQQSVGYAWDEAYYYEPSMKVADWLIEVLRGNHPYSVAVIDEYWGERWEHPSLPKLLMGLSIRMYPEVSHHLWAMRLPSAVLFGLSLTLIYLLGRRAFGTWPALASALIFATMPRVFGHAHFASLEMPLIFTTLLVVFCFLRGLDSPLWAAFTGLAFGLALATKINAFFLPVALVLWAHLFARRQYVNNLFAMLTLGPLTMVAVWPWLWPSVGSRLLQYLFFHAQHQQTALYFMDQTWGYGRPNAPWFYPLTMIGVTVPLISLLFVGVGVLKTAARLPRRPYAALYLMIVFVQLAVACAPSTPRYDGIRLFLWTFPFLALLGGSAFVTLIRLLQKVCGRPESPDPHHGLLTPRGRWIRNAILGLLVLDGASACVRYYPAMLSYFNPVVGGLRGAQARGFEVTYWGESVNLDVIETLNHLPDGTKIMPLALHELCLQHYQLWGVLKDTLRIGGLPPYDYHLLQMRRGFFVTPEHLLADTHAFPVVQAWGKPQWGVPLLKLYRTGPAFEAALAQVRAQQAQARP